MTQGSTPPPSVSPRAHRVHITCTQCGQRHALERCLVEPATVYIICHDCEASLRADYPELTGSENDGRGISPPPPTWEEGDGTAR